MNLCFESNVDKSAIIASFEEFVSKRSFSLYLATTRQQTDRLWDSLPRKWQNDPDIACAALAASLSPRKVSDVFQDAAEDFAKKACQCLVKLFTGLSRGWSERWYDFEYSINDFFCFLWKGLQNTLWENEPDIANAALQLVLTNHKARSSLWQLIPKKVQQAPHVSFGALNNRILSFSQLHASVRTRESLLAGLQQRQLKWERLPLECMRNVEYALAIHPSSRPLFAALWVVVTEEKDRLWTEYALHQPNHISVDDWTYAPDCVMDNKDLMSIFVKQNPQFAAFISERLASDFKFIDTILANSIEALIWLPALTFKIFPQILNNSTLKAIALYNDRPISRKAFADKLSEAHLSNRNFVTSFVYHTLCVPECFRQFKDKELLKLLVLACRLKSEERGYPLNISSDAGSLDPDTNVYIELLRFGVNSDVRYCFSDIQFTRNNYKVWVASHRFCSSVATNDPAFPKKALSQLQTFQGFVTCMVHGVRSQDSLLHKLDQAEIKFEIASYLDVPKSSDELDDLLVAAPKVAPSSFLFPLSKDRGAELLKSLDLDPSEADYGYQYLD